MFGFFIGAGTAIVLAAMTFVVLESATISTIDRIENPSVNLEGVHRQYPGVDRAERVFVN